MIRESKYGNSYWSFFMKSFEEEAAKMKYKFAVNIISQEDKYVYEITSRLIGVQCMRRAESFRVMSRIRAGWNGIFRDCLLWK